MSQFKILWIDDQTKKCKRDARTIEKYIESMGFEPIVDFEDDISDASLRKPGGRINRAIKARNVDLFIIDYNLKNEIFGSDIIEEIRSDNDIYTDIVFYSSDPKTLIDTVKKSFDEHSAMKYFDGVYVVPLGDEFTLKVKYIITKIVRSWYNAHSIRGVLLSKASKFEQLAAKIIEENYTPCLNRIKDKLSAKSENVLRTTKAKWERVNEAPDPISSILADSINFNWAVKKLILKELLDQGVIVLPSWDALEEIFALRNDFAHNSMHLEEGILVLSKNGQYIKYTESEIEHIREKLSVVEKDLLTLIPAESADEQGADNENEHELVSVER